MASAAQTIAPPRSEPCRALRPERVASIDALRGLVMVLMAIDHAHHFLSDTPVDLADPSRLSYAQFFTRVITHLCAPTFVFLAGLGAALQLRNGRTRPELSGFLLKRGLCLVALEFALVGPAFFFTVGPPALVVFWVIGMSMAILAGLLRLPTPILAVFSLAVIAFHDLTDQVHAASLGTMEPVWRLLHQFGPIYIHHRFVVFVAYPLAPWFAVMSLGYCFAAVLRLPADRRIRVNALLGSASVTLFLVLRWLHAYGDPNAWSAAHGFRSGVTTFFNVEKYPPSLQFLLLTLGIALLLLAGIDALFARGRGRWLQGTLEVYGRVPLAFYIVHLFVLHAAAVLLCLATGHPTHWLFLPAQPDAASDQPPGYGLPLPGVYLAWALVLLLLYRPCRAYAAYKRRHPEKAWLSYL